MVAAPASAERRARRRVRSEGVRKVAVSGQSVIWVG
jgi:hypothetical protein